MKNIFNTFLLIILGMIFNPSKGDIVLKQESNHEFLSSYYDDKNSNSLTSISDEYLKVKENEKYICYIFLEFETRIFYGTSFLIDFENVWESDYIIDSLDHYSCDQWGGDLKIL